MILKNEKIMKKIIVLTGFFLVFVGSIFSQGEWTYDNLTTFKQSIGSTHLGPYAFFAGGFTSGGYTSEVEIYNTQSKDWIYNQFSLAREFTAGASGGSKVFFAGGADESGAIAIVDIYDTLSGQWDVAELSEARVFLSAVSKGNEVLFAGGGDLSQGTESDVVDIYNTDSEEWSTSFLSEARGNMGSAVVGDFAFFAGGFYLSSGLPSSRVDIYNFSTGAWTTAELSQPRYFLAAVTVGQKILFAGGMGADDLPSKRVDIYDAVTGEWSIDSLSVARAFWDHENAASVCGKAYFIGGWSTETETYQITGDFNVIDIYDEASGAWSVEYLPYNLFFHSTVAVDDKLIIAGGGTIAGQFIQLRDVVRIYTCTTVATREVDFQAYVDVYPNPTSGTLHLAFQDNIQEVKVCITDIAGKLIYATSGLNAKAIEINTNGFAEGVYVIQLQTPEGIQSQKIVVSR